MASHKPLLENPSVTIYLDGLVFLVHDENRRLSHAAIHTQAENHELKIEVKRARDSKLLFPPEGGDLFDGSHAHIKGIEPLQLFVDSGKGFDEGEFSAKLHKPAGGAARQGPPDENSFEHVLDFEGNLYKRALDFKRGAFAVLEIAQGEFYSAHTRTFDLKSYSDGDKTKIADEGKIKACALLAADIEGGGAGRYIVLKQSQPDKEIFRIALEEGEYYVINVFNLPVEKPGQAQGLQPVEGSGHVHGHEPGHDHGHEPAHDQPPVAPPVHAHGPGPGKSELAAHFLQYYELFALKPEDKVYFVDEIEGEVKPAGGRDFPPCIAGAGGLSRNYG